MPIAAAAWISAAVATYVPDASVPVAVASWGLAVVALLCAGACGPSARAGGAADGARVDGVDGHGRDRRTAGGRRTALALCAVALAAGGAVAAHVATAAPARAALAAVDVDGGRWVDYTLTVTGKVEPSAAGVRFDAVTTRVAYGDSDRAVAAPVVVRATEGESSLDVGATLRVRGTAFRADAGERAVLVVDAAEIEVLTPPAGALDVVSRLRAGLRATTAELPGPAGGLIAGLAVGDTSAVTAELDTAMKSSSLSHLTAVSGANCALVVAIAFAVAAWCGARRGVRVAAGLAALAGFVLLVTPEPSVVRAAAMAAIAMLGVLLGRIGAGVSLLTIAVAGILIADPWLCSSLGFALSAAATGALLLLARPLGVGMGRWMPGPLAVAVSVPLAAQLACGPLLILVQPAVSAQGVLANMIAAPAAPVGTVLGLIACLSAGIPIIGTGLAGLAWLPAAWIAGTAESLGGLAVLPWLDGAVGALCLAVVGAAIAALIIAAHPGIVRLAAGAVIAVTAGLLLGTGPVGTMVQRLEVPAGWGVAACDVGQGDAVVLRSAGHVMLVDTGPDPAPLTACLDRLGIGRIDVLVLTHFDMDHRGGLPAVIGRVGTVLHGPPAAADDERVLAGLSAAGARLVRAVAGQTGMLGEANWRVHWPGVSAAYSGNDASVVVSVAGGGIPSIVLLGDLSAQPQASLARSLTGSYDVVKVAHHGSADQDSALYARIAPALALITVGENDYGHPRDEILLTLQRLGATIARTDQSGLLLVGVGDDGALTLWRERGP